MRTPPHARKPAVTLLVVAALAFAWHLFAPPALGGQSSWVVTDGISMQPHFHSGDLVLVHRESSYHRGEIVAYNNHMLAHGRAAPHRRP